MAKRYQVIIVGGGPVGVALAVDLGQRGISCALVERHLTPAAHPEGAEPHRSARSSTSTSGASRTSCAPRGSCRRATRSAASPPTAT